jgi:FeS assembly SUF system protein
MDLQHFINASAKESDLLAELQNQQISQEQIKSIAAASTFKDKVIEILKTIRDPEIPVNIWDLGLVYRLDVEQANKLVIDMTLTAPGCPVAGAMPDEVKNRITKLSPETEEIEVNMVWNPRWNKDMMSDEAKLMLDMW